MRKVGIITLDGIYNYGNRLQNLAVKKIYEREGFCAETLVIKRSFFREAWRYLDAFFKNPKKTIKFIRFNNKLVKQKYIFNKKALPPEKIVSEYDFFSVGSDQVWNPNLRKKDKHVFYLSFAEREKRIALSASIALDEIPDVLTDSFKKGVEGFDHISVREKKGAEIIKELTGQSAEVLVDPTLALTAGEWEEVLGLKDTPREKYLLLYFLGEVSTEFMEKAEAFAKEKGLKIVSAHIKGGLGEKNDFSPVDFVSLIRDAEYMFTDSFHGVAFSINFNTPFYAFARQNSENDTNTVVKSRITSILEIVGLESRLVGAFPESPEKISFEAVNAVLEKEREKVSAFVKSATGR